MDDKLKLRSMENIIQRYENSPAAEKRVYSGGILKKRENNAFHVPEETTDEGSNSGDVRSIDETDISKLDIDQLSEIEGLLEDALRWTSAKKTQLEASSIATLQRKGKAAIAERSFMEIASGQAKKQVAVGGGQQSGEGVDLALGLSLSVGSAGGEQWVHRTTPIDLNVP